MMQFEQQENERKIHTHKPEIDLKSKMMVRSTPRNATVFDRLGSKSSQKFLVNRQRAMAPLKSYFANSA